MALTPFQAIVYEPLWIRNLPPPTHIKHLPYQAPHVRAGYQSGFLPDPLALSSPFLQIEDNSSILSDLPPVPPVDKPSTIVPEDPAKYRQHFTKLLALELASLQEKAHSYKLNHAPLALEKPRVNVVGQLTTTSLGVWTLQVPGIREDVPRIFVGDMVLLRKIDLHHQAVQEYAFEARVIGSLKREGKVYVDSDTLWATDSAYVAGTYMVEFKVNSQQICLMQNAVSGDRYRNVQC
jgi:hypothetical protein